MQQLLECSEISFCHGYTIASSDFYGLRLSLSTLLVFNQWIIDWDLLDYWIKILSLNICNGVSNPRWLWDTEWVNTSVISPHRHLVLSENVNTLYNIVWLVMHISVMLLQWQHYCSVTTMAYTGVMQTFLISHCMHNSNSYQIADC